MTSFPIARPTYVICDFPDCGNRLPVGQRGRVPRRCEFHKRFVDHARILRERGLLDAPTCREGVAKALNTQWALGNKRAMTAKQIHRLAKRFTLGEVTQSLVELVASGDLEEVDVQVSGPPVLRYRLPAK